ncbi:glycosyltransferase [Coleofasciculus sp. FACHB-T130]|uniref:glycosyltransferase n=1 Tax=Cyanophyceae TaxID=3028117 RepID=UPI0016864F88|nr:glycosyltransferase [Coleofasciculus sp. FACHB-T130]MBD1881914.1 glycosyltransferase [Coleofasciculus sp. FACHB-T130]
MTTSYIKNKISKRQVLKRIFRLRMATLLMVGIVVFAAAIATAWFAGEGKISQLFAELNTLQENPPLWLQAPMKSEYLLVPTVALLVIVLIVMKISPKTDAWSRFLVVGILLGLTGRYIVWRSLSTLNVADPLNGVFSLGLFFMEMLMLSSSTIQLFLMLNVKERHREADQMAKSVIDGSFLPTVDIFIPTYNEAVFIVKRTIIGCQALDYPNKTVYLLDDTKRPEMHKLAEELGCEYKTRLDNRHAKAGNLNHAFPQTSGELIVVFDADFIPNKNFLTRTVGFFQDETVALVQTPQSFYNSDPIAYNLGLEHVLTPEEEVFYRQIQPIRDAAGSVICSGTSFIVRRSALEAAGGFATNSLSEDYFTGICLSAQGYQLIYLDEKLSAGLAAENIAAHATQRLRWAQGTLQAFFIEENPLTISGLSPLQRLAHLEGLLHWFTSLSRVYFLFIPLAYSFFGVIPVRAMIGELLYYFLPYYVVQLSVFSWLNYRSRSALLTDIYTLVLCIPLALTVLQAMLKPFSKEFKVTPKGISRDRFSFNWNLAWPLIILFIASVVSLWRNLGMCIITGNWQRLETYGATEVYKGIGLGWIWSGYNLLMIGIALLILLDVPKPDIYEWFDLRRVIRLNVAGQKFWGITTIISEAGAQIALTHGGLANDTSEMLPVTLEIMEEKLELQGKIIHTGFRDEYPTVQVAFEKLNLKQYRCLVEMLFCRPGQWKRREAPGEFGSLLLILKILLRPRILFDREPQVRAIAVSKI